MCSKILQVYSKIILRVYLKVVLRVPVRARQVLNLELAVAVTHNYCSSATFPRIWAHTHRG